MKQRLHQLAMTVGISWAAIHAPERAAAKPLFQLDPETATPSAIEEADRTFVALKAALGILGENDDELSSAERKIRQRARICALIALSHYYSLSTPKEEESRLQALVEFFVYRLLGIEYRNGTEEAPQQPGLKLEPGTKGA